MASLNQEGRALKGQTLDVAGLQGRYAILDAASEKIGSEFADRVCEAAGRASGALSSVATQATAAAQALAQAAQQVLGSLNVSTLAPAPSASAPPQSAITPVNIPALPLTPRPIPGWRQYTGFQ